MADCPNIPDGIIEDKEAWVKLNAPIRRIAINFYRIISGKYGVDRIFVRGRSKVQFNFFGARKALMSVSVSMHSALKGQLKYYNASIFSGRFTRAFTVCPDESRLVAIFSSIFEHF